MQLGIDGAGKSTAVAATVKTLRQRGRTAHAAKIARYRPLLAQEALGTQRMIRSTLVVAETLHIMRTEILPRHETGSIVVCDRYWTDSAVCLSVRGMSAETSAAFDALPPADLEVILDSPLEVAQARCAGMGERWTPAFRSALVQVHADLAAHPDAAHRLRLDASRPPEDVADRIVAFVESYADGWR